MHGDARIGVDVEFDDLDAVGQRFGQLVNGRRHGLAGRAPLGPEIHQHRPVGRQHLSCEISVGHMLGHSSPPSVKNDED
ncbi:hypothetical protein FQZ97_1198490 [compost metagenome]